VTDFVGWQQFVGRQQFVESGSETSKCWPAKVQGKANVDPQKNVTPPDQSFVHRIGIFRDFVLAQCGFARKETDCQVSDRFRAVQGLGHPI
jgi:hypothetical protein